MAVIIHPNDIRIEIDANDYSIDIKAIWRDRRVGYIWTIIEDTSLKIADIRVYEDVSPAWPILHGLLTVFGAHRRTVSFREMGIGGRMMGQLLSAARTLGFQEVWGSLVEEDILGTPYLLDWYRRLGFSVVDPDDERMPHAVQKITMRLKRNEAHAAL